MSQGNFTGAGAQPAADQRRQRRGVMWVAERPLAEEAAIAQPAGDRLDHAEFERLGRFERRQDAGKARGQHRLADTGRADHQQVMTASNTPATLVSEPSSATSPSAVYPASSSSGSTSIAARSANAIGRSKWLPSFSTSAGARLTVMWREGNDRPSAANAERTRSRDSATVLSGNPTTAKA